MPRRSPVAEEIDKNETRDFDLAAMNLSVAHAKLADFEMSNQEYARAFEGFSRSLAIAERVLRSPRTNEYTETARKGFVARSLDELGWVTYQLGKPAEAIALFNRSLALYAEVMASRRDEENLSAVAEIHRRMATLHQHNKAERLALEHFEKAASRASRDPRPRAEKPVLQAESVDSYWMPWAMRIFSWDSPMRPRNRTTNHSP